MFLPLGTDRGRRRPTQITYLLIGINIVVTVVMLVLQRFAPEQFERLYHTLWLERGVTGWWTYVTYAFLHDTSSAWHLIGNMVFLWVFGPNVEDRFGRIWYLLFYLVGAAVSGAAFALLASQQIAPGVVRSPPLVGASGAVSAVSGAFLVLFPFTRIRTLVLFFIIGFWEIPAIWYIGFHLVWDFIFLNRGDNVAHEAHLAGYGYGAAVAASLVMLRILPREPYDLFSILRQKARKRKFQEFSHQKVRDTERATKKVARSGAALEGKTKALASARAAVSEKLASNDFEGAGLAYRDLLAKYKDDSATTLARDTQMNLANALFKIGEHETAAQAYERFLRVYANDRESATVKLMLGLLYMNYLDRAGDAKPLLRDARNELDDPEERELAGSLLSEAGD